MRFQLAVFAAFAACLVVSSEPQEGDCGAGEECPAAADVTSEEALAPLGVPNEDVIEVLVRDFFAVGRNNDEPTLAGWEAGGAKFRYTRELKDRYDFQWNRQMRLFGAGSLHQFADRDAGDLSAVHGAADALETLGKVETRDTMLTLLDKLNSSRERTFVSTEVSTLDAPQDMTMDYLIETSHRLRGMSAELPDEFPPYASQPGSVWNNDDRKKYMAAPIVGVPDQQIQAARCVFDITCMPAHRDLVELFPWLSADATDPVHPDPELEGSVAEVHLDDLIAPANFVFLFSNELYKVCEVLSKEYIFSMAAYLLPRLIALRDKHALEGALGPVRVLELGAGTGALSAHLKSALSQMIVLNDGQELELDWVACDYMGRVSDPTNSFPVQAMGNKEAMESFQPHMVFASWMSMGADWTAMMRNTPSVQEYVLIGEIEFGSSGDPERTWAIQRKAESFEESGISNHVTDNWERVDLDAISLFQIARTDGPYTKHHSRTVSFRRPLVKRKRKGKKGKKKKNEEATHTSSG